MTKNIFLILVFVFVQSVFSTSVFGHAINVFDATKTNNSDPATAENPAKNLAFPNPILLKSDQGCRLENINLQRFDKEISTSQSTAFCEVLQEIAVRLNGNWSPALKAEMQQIWWVFLHENVKIRPMKSGTSGRVLAAAEAFTDNTPGAGFNASFYLRVNRVKDKSFFYVFMHELRHVYDFYDLYKNQTHITEAELEKRGFRIMGEIYQETQNKPKFYRLPTFWEDGWKNLPQTEIAQKRDKKIEKFMRGNGFYKHLLKNPETHPVGYLPNQTVAQRAFFNPVEDDEDKNEKLPDRIQISQTQTEIPQQIKEISFDAEKASNPKNPDELLRAALVNEKNLYRKMDNFVYDQNLQLQCWKKQQVTENYELNSTVARTRSGETLIQNQKTQPASSKSSHSPACIQNLDSIETDATETFWSAPYLDQMPIKFEYFTEIDGIAVARYTVLQPTLEKFKQIAAQYSGIKPFRAFIGTIFVSTEDSQIVKFWGTSAAEPEAASNPATRTYASYCATAVRQKLASGIWVTTLLNTVAAVNEKNKLKPYSYVVKYQNYRQGTSDVKILDDTETASR